MAARHRGCNSMFVILDTAIILLSLLVAAGLVLTLMKPLMDPVPPGNEVSYRQGDEDSITQNTASPRNAHDIRKSHEEVTHRQNKTKAGQSYVTVSTPYGDVRGLTYKVSKDENIDIFFGIPYAKPPVGKRRLARPEPITHWIPTVKDATWYPNICIQETPTGSTVVKTSEDCLYLNIYSPRASPSKSQNTSKITPLPVMMHIHGGSFRDGTANIINCTNLALKGVVCVTINYRLNGFGFLSTQDDVIPGNFGLLDAALALEFVKTIIGSFRGDPQAVTLFGASAGSAMVSQMALSPLTRGKFQGAIMESGPGTSNWASYKPGSPIVPRKVALDLGRKLNCPLPPGVTGRNQSLALLRCLRNNTAEKLIENIRNLTATDYKSSLIFAPVSGDSFGFLPQPPSALASDSSSLVPIPMMFGWSSNDSSWTVNDPDDKGENYLMFAMGINAYISSFYPSQATEVMYERALEIYKATDPSTLSPYDVRYIDILLRTDLFMESFIVKEARQFSRAAGNNGGSARKSAENRATIADGVASRADSGKPKTFVYQYDYRPSYKQNPKWQGVKHMDELGMLLGLPNGRYPLSFPNTNETDRRVADMMTTMWSNFAKYGDPTPQALPGGVKWPEFGHKSSDQNLLLIRPAPEVRRFDRDEPVVLWTGSSGLDN